MSIGFPCGKLTLSNPCTQAIQRNDGTWVQLPTRDSSFPPCPMPRDDSLGHGPTSARSMARISNDAITPRSEYSQLASEVFTQAPGDDDERGSVGIPDDDDRTWNLESWIETPRSLNSNDSAENAPTSRKSRVIIRDQDSEISACEPLSAFSAMVPKAPEQICKRLAGISIGASMLLSAIAYVWYVLSQAVPGSGGGAPAARLPIVLVPGLASSALEFQLTHADVPRTWCPSSHNWSLGWVDPTKLLPGAKDCLMANLQLFYNAETDAYSNRRGVEVRPVDFGGLHGVYELDPIDPWITLPIFKPIIDRLKKHGYKAGKDLHGAPYDWRLAGDAHGKANNGIGGLYPNLTKLIEDTSHRNNAPVILITHSLGGVMLLHYLHTFVSDTWRKQYVAGWFSVNGVFGGTSKVARMFASGLTFGLPLIPSDYFKAMETGAPISLWMLPSPRVYGDTVVVQTPTKKYRARDWLALLKDMNNTQMVNIADKFERTGLSPDSWWNKFLPDLPTHFIVTNGFKTPLTYAFDGSFVEGFNEVPSSTEYVDGDGTVPWDSLVSYRQWEGAHPNGHWSEEVLGKVNHRNSITDDRVSSSIVKFIEGCRQRVYSGHQLNGSGVAKYL